MRFKEIQNGTFSNSGLTFSIVITIQGKENNWIETLRNDNADEDDDFGDEDDKDAVKWDGKLLTRVKVFHKCASPNWPRGGDQWWSQWK